MCRTVSVALLAIVIGAAAALAGVPVPPLCGCDIAGQIVPCQYRFVADGSMDVLVVNVIDLGVWASGLGKGCQVPNPNCPY